MQENQNETKKKMTYLDWYEKDRERRRQIKRSPSFYYGCLLPVFLIASLLISFIGMGEGALMYSDDVYYDIKAVMDQAIKKGEGIDSKILQEGIDVEEEKDGVKTGHVEHYEGVDRYEDVFDETGHKLKATVEKGYFKATLTADLDAKFGVTKTYKNYQNAQAYMIQYGFRLACGLVKGFAVWLLLGIVSKSIARLIADISLSRKEKKEAIEIKPDEEMASEKEQTDEAKETEETAEEKEKEAEIKEFPKEVVSQ